MRHKYNTMKSQHGNLVLEVRCAMVTFLSTGKGKKNCAEIEMLIFVGKFFIDP